MAASARDAHPWAIYGARMRLYFPILDADGDPVTGAATPDSERSLDGGTFSDCTNEISEIATSSGIYSLDLVAAETTSKFTVVRVQTATAGAKTTVLTLPVYRLPQVRAGTASSGSSDRITLDSGAVAIDDFYNGYLVRCVNDTPANVQGQLRRIIDYIGSTREAIVEGTWGTNPSSSTTFEILPPPELSIPPSQFVDAWLVRHIAGGQDVADGTTARTLMNAMRRLRNRVTASIVYREDDSTTAYTLTVTTNPSADPITEIDPS